MTAQSTQLGVPADVTSPRAKLVFLYLAASGGATLDELETELSMTKLSLYGVLRTLRERELVEKMRGRYVVSSCFAATGLP